MKGNKSNGSKRPVGRPKREKAVRVNFWLDEDLYTIAKMRCESEITFTKYLNNLIRRALMTE